MKIVDSVVDMLDEKQYVCGVDMIFDRNQKPWILELNSKPGMSFYNKKKRSKNGKIRILKQL